MLEIKLVMFFKLVCEESLKFVLINGAVDQNQKTLGTISEISCLVSLAISDTFLTKYTHLCVKTSSKPPIKHIKTGLFLISGGFFQSKTARISF